MSSLDWSIDPILYEAVLPFLLLIPLVVLAALVWEILSSHWPHR